jgi:hypothetical protein
VGVEKGRRKNFSVKPKEFSLKVTSHFKDKKDTADTDPG